MALSMASRRAANFTFSASMPPPTAAPSSSEPGQVLADRIHLVARAVGVLAVFVVEFGPHFRVHRGRPVEDVGGKAALGIHVARNFADRPHHLQPALRDRDLVHGLVFRHGHIDGEAAADGGNETMAAVRRVPIFMGFGPFRWYGRGPHPRCCALIPGYCRGLAGVYDFQTSSAKGLFSPRKTVSKR